MKYIFMAAAVILFFGGWWWLSKLKLKWIYSVPPTIPIPPLPDRSIKPLAEPLSTVEKVTVRLPEADASFALKNAAAGFLRVHSAYDNQTNYMFVFPNDNGAVACGSAAAAEWREMLLDKEVSGFDRFPDDDAGSPHSGKAEYDGAWSVPFPQEWRGAEVPMVRYMEVPLYEKGLAPGRGKKLGSVWFVFLHKGEEYFGAGAPLGVGLGANPGDLHQISE
ncbi:MAG: hypothetical protein LBS90_00640, partial [Oscillospiraceae bacterium]|nr:hypothetical protein [Oscillospiraceae bacterium]